MNNDTVSLSPTQLAWRKFKTNKLAVLGLWVIAVAAAVAVLGGNIRPDKSKHANNQQVSLAALRPGEVIEFLQVRNNEAHASTGFWDLLFFGGASSAYTEIPLHSYQVSGDSIVGFRYGGSSEMAGAPFRFHLADVCYALAPESLHWKDGYWMATTFDGQAITTSSDELHRRFKEGNHVMSKRFALGSDKFGRDMLSRLMAGTIVSLSVGLISVLISLLLGVSLGALAGYYRGWVDDLITWLINVVWSIPTLLLVIAITFALGKGFVQVFVAVGLIMWVEVARVVRGQVLSVRSLEYVEAAKVLGFGSGRIISRHILPNVLGPVIVISAANFASAILLEAGLSFLGIGAQIPMASWGQMIKEHYPYITTAKAYLALLPGLCIIALVLAFMLVGNGLRDSVDTRQNS